MKLRKAYQFRIYPNEKQRQALVQAFGCCRLVYNLALEQRSSFGRKGRNITCISATNELPALKETAPFLNEAPSQCLQQALRHLDRGFINFFEGRAGYPKPRQKYVDDSCSFPQGFKIHRDVITLPKIGAVKTIIHRPIRGTPKSITISRDGDRWLASISVELQTKAPAPRLVSETGVDLNVVTGAVISNGDIMPMPRISDAEQRKLARLQKNHARKKKGSKNRNKSRRAIANFHARIKRRRHDAAHKISSHLASAYTHVAFEDLRLKNMTASAKGTIKAPGKNIAQKAGLNRSILDVAPGLIKRLTEYKVAWAGGVCVAVDPAYTSQYCSECARHPKGDAATAQLNHGRITRDDFLCPLCGFSAHADINAARNILALGRQQWMANDQNSVGPPETACRGLRPKRAREAGKKKGSLRRLPKAA
jgi:putative transposase